MANMLCYAVLFFVVSVVDSNNSYVIFVPRETQAGVVTNITINILNAPRDVDITVDLLYGYTGPLLSSTSGIVKSGSIKSFPVYIPDTLSAGRLYVKVTGSGGLDFAEETTIDIDIANSGLQLYIQTDKGIYKAGQTVLFRAFAIYPNLTMYDGPLDISIYDPKNNKIKQYLQVKGQSGVFNDSMIMGNRPVLGNWTIAVNIKKSKFERSFKVKEYVLPRFKVDVNIPKFITEKDQQLVGTIKATYTYGEPVTATANLTVTQNPPVKNGGFEIVVEVQDIPLNKGSATFTVPLNKFSVSSDQIDRNLIVQANVTDVLTNNSLSATAKTAIKKTRIKFEIMESSKETFKPGLMYYLQIKLETLDGAFISDPNPIIQLETSITTEGPVPATTPNFFYAPPEITTTVTNNFTYPRNGKLYLEIPIQMQLNASRIYFKAIYKTMFAYKSVHRFKSQNDNYIDIRSDQHMIKVGQNIQVFLQSSKPLLEVMYIVFARGTLISSGSVNSLNSNTSNISIPTTTQMAPTAMLAVYCVEPNGEIVLDTLEFKLSSIFDNELLMVFDKDKAEPGTNVTLTVKSDPNSLVNIVAVDQSVSLLEDRNDISSSKILEGIDERFPIKVGHGSDVYSLVDTFPLKVLTDAVLYQNKGFVIPTQPAQGNIIGQQPLPTVNFHQSFNTFSPPPVAIRSNFPETWIWSSEVAGRDGVVNFTCKLPDTITTWVASAFSVNKDRQLEGISSSAEITAFRPFFVTLNLPYSVVRGEQVVAQITIFNYLAFDFPVLVMLNRSDGFQNIVKQANGIKQLESKVQTESSNVEAGSATTLPLAIVPNKTGPIFIEVTAQPFAWNVPGDGVRRQLLVEPEGIPQEKNFPVILRSNGGYGTTTNVSLVFPDDVVPDSKRIRVSVIGDFMGPTLHNLEQLIQLPTGCGEQTMMNLAPDVFIYEYLHQTNQLTPALKSKLIQYLEKGYQNELRFQRFDGSFSTFGNSDANGIMWLSAFVLKTFKKAQNVMLVDQNVLTNIVSWITGRQKNDGSFPEPGSVYHKEMKGGVSKLPHLTAYVLIALEESIKNNFTSTIKTQIRTAIDKSRGYLERVASGVTDHYGLALVSYALFSSGSTSTAKALFTHLNSKAIVKGDEKYWANDLHATADSKINPIDIETTSYALLSFAHIGAINDGYDVFKWLLSHRNSQGGFISTQDTVAGLDALSKFTALIQTHKPNMAVDMTSTPGSSSKSFIVNSKNALVLQSLELQEPFPQQLIFNASGYGLALVEVTLFYNVKQLQSDAAFDAEVHIEEETIDLVGLNVCSRYTKSGSSGMAILEVGVPSGFEIDTQKINPIDKLKRIEERNKKIVFYFDEMTKSPSCLKMKAVRTDLVSSLKPSPVRVYDYYQPGEQVSTFYESNVLKNSNVCDICKLCRPCRRFG